MHQPITQMHEQSFIYLDNQMDFYLVHGIVFSSSLLLFLSFSYYCSIKNSEQPVLVTRNKKSNFWGHYTWGLPFLYFEIVLAILYFALLNFILLISNLFLYSLNYFADVHIVWFPTIMTNLSIGSRVCCIIFLYFICQMSFIELVFI